MPFRIIRNDITKMSTQAIVNTANACPIVGPGCDSAIYEAAGYEELLAYRKEHISHVEEGEVFLTPGFNLKASYIIHAVSPLYTGENQDEEQKLRSCYRKSLQLAAEKGIRSIAFPLISTGSFGYSKEEGMRIAVDEINTFLLTHEMGIWLVVFGEEATQLGSRIYPGLKEYIDQNYVSYAETLEYGLEIRSESRNLPQTSQEYRSSESRKTESQKRENHRRNHPRSDNREHRGLLGRFLKPAPERDEPVWDDIFEDVSESIGSPDEELGFGGTSHLAPSCSKPSLSIPEFEFDEKHERRLRERMKHLSDTFSEYLMYLIQEHQMENAEVWKRAIVDKKVFSKIKNNPDYHPKKLTALCLCVGAKLNLDESRDLLARAGYALSPCDMTDVIFSYFIENEIYDMIELDIKLEEYGLPCIIQ